MTRKVQAAVVVVGLGTLVAVAASVLAAYQVAVALVALLVGFAVVLLLDIRGRTQTISAFTRASARRDRSLSAALRSDGARLATIAQRQEAIMRHHEKSSAIEDSLRSHVSSLSELAGTGGLLHDRDHLALLDALRGLRDNVSAESATLSELISATAQETAERIGAPVQPEDLASAVQPLVSRHANRVIMAVRTETRETEALLQALPRIPARATLPPSGLWAINPRGLAHLVDLVTAKRPNLVVELGSGTSSVWLGYLLEKTGGRVISIEQNENYAQDTREQLLRHELRNVEVRLAPLEDVGVGEGLQPWYPPTAFSDLEDIDILLVDGPPRATGPAARWPALPVLHDRMADGGLIVLDDGTRGEELEVAERWMAEYPGLTQLDHNVSEMAVFSLAKASDGGTDNGR